MKCVFLEKGRFPMRSPESQGIPSRAILNFLHGLEEIQSDTHSLQIFKNGYCVLDAYARPFEPWTPHRIYSAAKNISGLAMLFAIDEGLCSFDDKVMKFFPKYDTPELSPMFRDMTLYDMMAMATGQVTDPFDKSLKEGMNWQDGFFATPIVEKPGTFFMYNNTVPYMLGVIVKKVSGLNYIDYLRPRFLDPVGVYATVEYTKDGDWELEGSSTVCTPEGVAKLSLFYLQMGMWNGKQLLSRELMEKATSYLIPCGRGGHWGMGYGLQMWRNEYGGFRISGGNGQTGMCIPEMDLCIAWTSWDGRDEQRVLCGEKLFKHIYALPLEEDEAALADQAELRDYVENWSCAPKGEAEAPVKSGRYVFGENRVGVSAIEFDFERHDVFFEQDGETFAFRYGVGGEFIKNRRNMRTTKVDAFSSPCYQAGQNYVLAAGAWQGDTFTLELRQNAWMTFDIYQFTFTEGGVSMFIENINEKRIRIRGGNPARPGKPGVPAYNEAEVVASMTFAGKAE